MITLERDKKNNYIKNKKIIQRELIKESEKLEEGKGIKKIILIVREMAKTALKRRWMLRQRTGGCQTDGEVDVSRTAERSR